MIIHDHDEINPKGMYDKVKFNPFKPVGIYASHRFRDAYVPQSPSA